MEKIIERMPSRWDESDGWGDQKNWDPWDPNKLWWSLFEIWLKREYPGMRLGTHPMGGDVLYQEVEEVEEAEVKDDEDDEDGDDENPIYNEYLDWIRYACHGGWDEMVRVGQLLDAQGHTWHWRDVDEDEEEKQ